MASGTIGTLPEDLHSLDHTELRDARSDRDERITSMFRRWPSLTKIELLELRALSDERQRLARHLGSVRRLRSASRPGSKRSDAAPSLAEWESDGGTS